MSNEHPWLANYPAGVPAEIDVNEFPSIPSVLEGAIANYADRPAFSNLGKTLTYAQVDAYSRQFAAYLLGELKLKKGDRVAIMMPNCLQYPIATFGVLRAGLTVVNTNPMYTARELRHQLMDSGASAILVLDNFGSIVEDVLADTQIKQVITTGLGDMLGFPKGPIVNFVLKHVKKMVPDYDIPGAIRFNDALTLGQRHTLPDITIDSEDIAFLQYTGGTTGVAKGAMLTHRNLVANMQQASAWIGTNAQDGRGSHRHRAAAVPHLCADGERPGLHEVRRQEHPDHQSARHAWLRQGAQARTLHRHHRRQHAVQRPAQYAGLSDSRLLSAALDAGRRHGRATRGRRALETGHRRDPGRSLRPDRNLAGRLHQSAGPG